MMATVSRILEEVRRGLEPLYGSRLEHLILYGSQARGEGQPGSDIDLLVVLDGPVRPAEEIARCGELAAGLSLEHGVVISLAFVSAQRYGVERSPLLLNIQREGVAV